MNKVIGIDLGFVTSPTCISIIENIDNENKNIKCSIPLGPFTNFADKSGDKILSRKLIVCAIDYIINLEKPDLITIERPFMQGMANCDFNKFLGMLENILVGFNYLYLAPTSIKKYMGGGRLEKLDIANNLLQNFKNNNDIKLIKKAISTESWDITDSIAIALAGYFDLIEKNKL